MRARLAGILAILTVLSLVAPLLGQTRRDGRRAPASRRNETPATKGTPPPPVETPAASPKQGAGTDTPPVQGYVPAPAPPHPGTYYSPFAIPLDPLDRGYWELYDREKPVTLTGKVTRVDWTNPNSYIYLSAQGDLWAIESGFIQLQQSSVNPVIKEEQTITVLGYLPRDEPEGELPARREPSAVAYLKTNHLIRAAEITTAFGYKIRMGQPPSEAEIMERLKCSAFGC